MKIDKAWCKERKIVITKEEVDSDVFLTAKGNGVVIAKDMPKTSLPETSHAWQLNFRK